jgi:hypothetical protein
MIDGPGVLEHGVCCIEPQWHVWARMGLLLGIVLEVAALIFTALGGAAWLFGRVFRTAQSP